MYQTIKIHNSIQVNEMLQILLATIS